jgi:hypothetical protein
MVRRTRDSRVLGLPPGVEEGTYVLDLSHCCSSDVQPHQERFLEHLPGFPRFDCPGAAPSIGDRVLTLGFLCRVSRGSIPRLPTSCSS